ncbi:MAG: NADH-quinone oxidoreductase subunit C, partial [Candidatus Bathyarchaeota archaeon]
KLCGGVILTSQVETNSNIVKRLGQKIGPENLLSWATPRPKRIFLSVHKGKLIEAVTFLTEEGFVHLSAITGLESEDGLEVIYHLGKGGLLVSLKVVVSIGHPSLPTITSIFPGAALYEREAHELLGLVFSGHPGLIPLVLPDEWPEGIYPLRKKWTQEEIRKKLLRET